MRPRSAKRLATLVGWSVVCVSASACEGSLRVSNAGGDVQKPAAVRILLVVNDEKKPVVGLGPWDFKVFEDGLPVNDREDLRIVGTDLSAKLFTVLLLDWSGHVAGSPDAAAMSDAASALVNHLRPKQQVAVYTFDGTADLHPVFAFGATDKQVKAGLAALKDYKPQDPTENLNGAVASGLKALRSGMGEHDLLSRGALVVVYHDADRAGRVTRDALNRLVRKPEYASVRRFAIGIGDLSKQAQLDRLEADESTFVGATGDLRATLDGIGTRIADLGRSYYFVVVCSGARAGEHELRIDVTHQVKDEKGAVSQQTGSLRHRFRADGFGPGCKPTIPDEIEILAPEEAPPSASPAPSASAATSATPASLSSSTPPSSSASSAPSTPAPSSSSASPAKPSPK